MKHDMRSKKLKLFIVCETIQSTFVTRYLKFVLFIDHWFRRGVIAVVIWLKRITRIFLDIEP